MCFAKQMLYRYFHGHTVCQTLPPQQRDALHGNLGGWDPLEASLADAYSGISHQPDKPDPHLPWQAAEEMPAASLLSCWTLHGAQPPALGHQAPVQHTHVVALCPMRFRARTDGDLKAPSWHGWMISFQQPAHRMSHCTLQPRAALLTI